MGLSIALITFNEESNITRFLDSIIDIADEIIIVDSYSTDKTKSICENYPSDKIKFSEKKFNGYGEQKNHAISLCSNDWILFLDADEIPNEELKKDVKDVIDKPEKDFFVYKIKLINHVGKYQLNYGGWGNVYRERFFNKNFAKYTNDSIHESLITNAKIGSLKGYINHYTYKNITHHVEKINIYSQMMADKMHKNGKKSSRLKIIFGPLFEFTKVFILKLGFLDGLPGFYVAKTMAFYNFLKYIKLYEKAK